MDASWSRLRRTPCDARDNRNVRDANEREDRFRIGRQVEASQLGALKEASLRNFLAIGSECSTDLTAIEDCRDIPDLIAVRVRDSESRPSKDCAQAGRFNMQARLFPCFAHDGIFG
jgi:hypothetical protein